ncbi:MAG: cupin domain-containing protein [Gammaproteobacteria bacterium]|nr:cupin domain-containing protein [Gammaproteobacteria bacterium]
MRPSLCRVTLPDGIDGASFLSEYWQRRPLLMRAALPHTCFPLAAEELAGLACEAEFESRLLIERGPDDWELRHGPFDEATFAALPERQWTLLVQDVDKFVPEVADLIDAFDFVPLWRIDDVMISYAADQGGVGPHIDAYDVFLMQAQGRRRWRLSYASYHDDDLVPGIDQRILARFQTDDEWILEPGDILYLPAGVAHWGIAEGPCMTYSLGFRAPSQQELAGDWFQHLVSLAGGQRLQDPTDLRIDDRGRLTEGTYAQAARVLRALPSCDSGEFMLWLGRYLTEPKPQFQIEPPDTRYRSSELEAMLARNEDLMRHPFARLCWTTFGDDQVVLYCQGSSHLLPKPLGGLVQYLAGHRRLDATDLVAHCAASSAASDLLLELINDGILEPESTLP